ncbi:MAG: hypothetical protein HN572_07240, partial [Kordiimonadaceae bacterium]|nr:hypothetical protein [Kordiimonadaceae bacterium]
MAGRRNAIKKSAKKSLLPTSVTEFLKETLVRLWGLALILSFVAFIAAFISYNVSDPSWNNVVEGTASNLLGLAGSHGADLLILSLGLGAYILVLPLLTWGWRVISLRG